MLDNELIDILRIDCRSFTEHEAHIKYLNVCFNVIAERKAFIKPEYVTSIKKLNLLPRTYNTLIHYKIDTIDKLLMLTEDELLRMRNLGFISLGDIIDKLKKYDNLQLIAGEYYSFWLATSK